MKLEDLKTYQLAMKLGEDIWEVVNSWDYYHKDTIGKQFVRAADSVAANISEGYGRFHFKENRHFNYIARGSLSETKTWLTKALNRKLVPQENYQRLMVEIETLGKMHNKYIKYINETAQNW